MDNKITKLLKHFVIYGFGSIAQALSSFALLPIITRYLSTTDYGIYTLINLVAILAGTVFYLGITSALPRSFYDYPEGMERDSVVSTALYMTLFGALLQIIIGFFCSSYLSWSLFQSDRYTTHLSIMFVAAAIAFINTFFQSYFRLLHKSKTVVTIGVVSSLLNFFIAIGLFHFTQLTLWTPILSFLICQSCIFLYSILSVRKHLQAKINYPEAKLMLKFGIPTILISMTVMLLEWSDRFLLNKFLSTSDVGIYSLSSKFGTLINTVLILPFTQIWNPLMMEQKNDPGVKLFFKNVFYLYFLSCFLFMVMGGSFFSELIFFFIKNKSFHSATQIIPFLIIANTIYGSINILAAGFFYNRSPATLIKIYLPFAILSFCLNYFLIQKWGYIGAALTNLIIYSCIPVSVYLNSKSLFSFPLGLNKIIPAFIIFSTLLAISYVSNYAEPLLRISVKVIINLVSVYLFFYFYKLNKKDFEKSNS